MDTFECQDILYNIFTNDAELLELFNGPSGDEQVNNVFRREELLLEEITPEKIPFVSFVFIDTMSTRNYIMNRGYLEFNVYVSARYQAMLIKRKIDSLVKQRFPDWDCSSERQVASGVIGILCYRWVYKNLVRS